MDGKIWILINLSVAIVLGYLMAKAIAIIYFGTTTGGGW